MSSHSLDIAQTKMPFKMYEMKKKKWSIEMAITCVEMFSDWFACKVQDINLYCNGHVVVYHWLAVTTSVQEYKVPMGTALVFLHFRHTPALILFAEISLPVPRGEKVNVRFRANNVRITQSVNFIHGTDITSSATETRVNFCNASMPHTRKALV